MSIRRDRGAAALEAAILLPVLVLLALGALDLGRAMFEAASVQEAAQEGVIFASTQPGNPAEAVNRAEELLTGLGYSGTASVTCDSDTQVALTIAHTFDPVSPFVPAIDLTHTETGQVLSAQACTPSS